MSETTINKKEIAVITLGCFLHDIGKVVQRADSNPIRQCHQIFGEQLLHEILQEANITDEKIKYYWHCISQSIKLHHANKKRPHLYPSTAEKTYIPWVVFESDNLAAAHDRNKINILIDDEGNRIDETDEKVRNKWFPSRRLQSIFTSLHKSNYKESFYDLWFKPYIEDGKRKINSYPYPGAEDIKDTQVFYGNVKQRLVELIKHISKDKINLKNTNLCIGYLEELFQFIPPDTFLEHTNDVSLFDHLKLTAAIGSCMFYTLDDKHSNWLKDYTAKADYSETPWKALYKEFRDEKIYLLFKADLSGIQDFIYNISSKGALKTLRGRSFYLELLLQQIADEILTFFSLSRCNQIYLGGGGFSLLLPNTDYVKKNLETLENKFNEFLFNKFQGRLHLSFGYSELSGNDIRAKTKDDSENTEQKKHPLNTAWKNISNTISNKKTRKFSHLLLTHIYKQPEEGEYSESLDECKICHKEEVLESIDNENNDLKVCSNCISFKDFGLWLTRNKYFKFQEDLRNNGIFPKIKDGELVSVDLIQADENDPEAFVFHNDDPYKPPKIYWSTVYAKSDNNPDENATFEELACKSTGVQRIGVLRADIDNLGKVFSSRKDNFGIKQDLKSISRDASVSKNLAKFFTHYLNQIIEDKYKDQISVVYSGGDDLLLVGAWGKVIDCAFKIEEKFKEYTLGTLTLSAGISIHGPKYPLYRMAKDSGLAEKIAKNQSGKNSLCIYFDDGILRENNPSHVFSWSEWKTVKNITEELQCLNISHGFLYELLLYIREKIENKDKLPFYRILYSIARMEEDNNNELKNNDLWEEFKTKYINPINSKDRNDKFLKYLETALNYHMLLYREVEREQVELKEKIIGGVR